MNALPDRIAVTGGAGFIGSHVIERLAAAGARVLVIDDLSHACGAPAPPGVELLVADEGSEEAARELSRFRPGALLHLAAKGGVAVALRDPGSHVRAVVGSTVAAYAAACAAGATAIVSASSGGAMYGEAGRLPADEGLPAGPRSAYGASKAAEEAYLGSFTRSQGVRGLALRFGNVYGPRQDGTGEAGVVAITCHRLLQGLSPTIYGDGGQTRDFVFVGDVADACLAALAAEVGGPINVGTGRETSIREVVEGLSDLHGEGVPITYAPGRAGEVRRSCLATDRARRELGWSAGVGLRDGLRSTLASFEIAATAEQHVLGG
ncbi:MAG TPA: NAD-dependent epimerase/dehydratase family protein [Candidatus Dormibacteraeota bacterium]|nr:NAD-dependent epimerase/dehydratase family protein [Candidatus Dormibacteraeota bacterium]